MGFRPYHLLKTTFNSYQRSLLISVTIFLTLFSVLLIGYSVYLTYLFYDTHPTRAESKSNVLNWIGLTAVGICLMIICSIGLRGAHIVNLDLLLAFFWGIMIFLGPFILAVVVGFDFFFYLDVFMRHYWTTGTFEGVRKLFCDPSSSFDTTCAVPLSVSSSNAIGAWCNITYNSTACTEIYTNAFSTALSFAETVIQTQNIITIFILINIMLTILICYRMITAPVITESMNDIINYLLVLPIGGN